MFRWIFLTIFCCFLGISGHANLLKDRLLSAKKGDFIVVEQNKMTTVLSVHCIEKNRLILEEVSIPSSLASQITSWKTWVEKSAPHHSSWVMYEIDIKSDEILECFSFSKSAWLKLSEQDYWLACLFRIPLSFVSKEDRKKIGPAPMHGEKDYRQVWNPPFIFSSKKYSLQSIAYRGIWPDDGTDLAKKRFVLYFDEKNISPFPCWIQISNPHITMNIRIINGGRKLRSPYKTLPKRPPEFVRKMQKTNKGYRLYACSPKYFEEHLLYVCDLSDPQKTLTRIAFQSIRNQEELILDVSLASLHGKLQDSHLYSWILTPTSTPSIHTTSKDSFLWKGSDIEE